MKAISFTSKDSTQINGYLYIPKIALSNEEKWPCIIMTHGFTALMEHQLDKFANVFTENGYAVLMYDQRNFGKSEGAPRYEIDPQQQVSDIRSAIDFLSSQPCINPDAIGLWGTSFSGGNVIVAAADDPRIKCVVAQVPFISGHLKKFESDKPDQYKQQMEAFKKEEEKIEKGGVPSHLLVASSNEEKAVMRNNPSAYQFFTSVPTWQNQVTFLSLKKIGSYYPIDYVSKVSNILFIVASNDSVNTAALAKKAFKEAQEPKHLVEFEGDHFDPYNKAFDICSMEALKWYKKHLSHSPQVTLRAKL